MEDKEPSFRTKTIEKLLKQHWQETTKINADSLKLAAELLRLFLIEGVNRAGKVAAVNGYETIEPEHIEYILPQLLLDFT
jgi:histone H3/H4